MSRLAVQNPKSKAGPVLVLLALSLISTVFLPLVGTHNLGPLFDWQLFASSSESYFDARLTIDDKQVLLSETPSKEFLNKDNYIYWTLVQQMGRREGDSARSTAWLEARLREAGAKLVSICRIEIRLEQYVRLSGLQKLSHCREI